MTLSVALNVLSAFCSAALLFLSWRESIATSEPWALMLTVPAAWVLLGVQVVVIVPITLLAIALTRGLARKASISQAGLLALAMVLNVITVYVLGS